MRLEGKHRLLWWDWEGVRVGPASGVGLLMAAETKQSPQPHPCQLEPIDTQPEVLKDPQLVGWGCCSLGMELCLLVLVCGAVLEVAGEWGWDPPQFSHWLYQGRWVMGAPCFSQCWFLMVTWGLSRGRGAFLN